MASDPMFTSPKRHTGFYIDPEMIHGSPPIKDISMYPWNWGSGAQEISLSPSSNCGSPESGERLKRGRPRADRISSLIQQGSQIENGIQCKICSRIFPREKSLQAHMRTHTGERPYICDYPGCEKAFCQSGQLKTHQRLHTGEKPFVCTVSGCENRFTHANRHCQSHPLAALRRDDGDTFQPAPTTSPCQSSPQVLQWLHSYAQRRQEKTPHKMQPKGMKGAASVDQDVENNFVEVKRRPARKRLISVHDNLGEDPVGLTNLDQNAVAAVQSKPKPAHVAETLASIQNRQGVIDLSCKRSRLSSTVANIPTVPKDSDDISADHQDRMLGALALMQLAHGKMP